ncbi:hypothetical protein HanIR_Chr01g0000191 [Helianthus annuus]|nr:hypothetical protein HanIR_Chr01g0000191 [Helianthus annuus]
MSTAYFFMEFNYMIFFLMSIIIPLCNQAPLPQSDFFVLSLSKTRTNEYRKRACAAMDGAPQNGGERIVVINDENVKHIHKIQDNGIHGLPRRVIVNKVPSLSLPVIKVDLIAISFCVI